LASASDKPPKPHALPGGAISQNGALLIIWRIFSGFGGGYLVVSGIVAALGSALPLLGLARGEALSLGILLALFIYVPVCLLMFASHRPWRDGMGVWGVGAGLVALAIAI
jgi:hypothetical protein